MPTSQFFNSIYSSKLQRYRTMHIYISENLKYLTDTMYMIINLGIKHTRYTVYCTKNVNLTQG